MLNKLPHTLFVLITLVLIMVTAFLPVISQDPTYHDFANGRTIFNTPHFWNIISNVPISIIGLLGLIRLYKYSKNLEPALIKYWTWFFAGVFLVGFGSAYYHQDPTNKTLVWDRIPIGIAIVSLLSVFLHERVSPYLARITQLPLVALAISSVFFWIYTEIYGVGDLRFYILVQFGTIILIASLMLLFPKHQQSSSYLFYAFLSYLLAKFFEYFDKPTYEILGNTLSGHTLKHLWVAVTIYFVYRHFLKSMQKA